MKILLLNETAFKLPNDFNGKTSDGLRLLADYLESDASNLAEQPGLSSSNIKPFSKKSWDDFQDVLAREGRVSGGISYQVLDNGKWIVVDDGAKK